MPIFEHDDEMTNEEFARQAAQAFERAVRKEWQELLGLKEEELYKDD